MALPASASWLQPILLVDQSQEQIFLIAYCMARAYFLGFVFFLNQIVFFYLALTLNTRTHTHTHTHTHTRAPIHCGLGFPKLGNIAVHVCTILLTFHPYEQSCTSVWLLFQSQRASHGSHREERHFPPNWEPAFFVFPHCFFPHANKLFPSNLFFLSCYLPITF
jgi:hypothetical protein